MENAFFTGIILPVVAGVLVGDVIFLRAKLWNWLRRKNKNLIDDIRPDGGGPRVYHMKTIEFHYAMVCAVGIFAIVLTFFLDLRSNSPGLVSALVLTCLTAGPVSLLFTSGVAYLFNKYWYMLTGSENHFLGVRPIFAWLNGQLPNIERSLEGFTREIEALFSNKQRR